MLLFRALLPMLFVIASPAWGQQKGPLVLAAASLQEAMTDAAKAWAGQRHAQPVIAFGASSALARQVEAGAPADLFVSADEQWMDYLAGRRLIRAESRATLLSNRLVLVAPAGSRSAFAVRPGMPLGRALGNGRLAMADPTSVPAGKYGKQALESLGVWRDVEGRLARAENVRAALALVERGVAPFGVVYATDAMATRGVRIVGVFPAASHAPITYPLAILSASKHPDAQGFRQFLLSPGGKRIFARHGFVVR